MKEVGELLEGRRILVSGVVNDSSIAFGAAQRARELGAEIVLCAFPRDLDSASEVAAKHLGGSAVMTADLTNQQDVSSLTSAIEEMWGGLDGALHAIAFAPRDALSGDFLDVPAKDLNIAFQTSAVSYASMGRLLRNLNDRGEGSLVGLDFDAAGAWPVYNWMGVCKAALESVNRYLARDLGSVGIRSNLIAAGPIHTRASGGIPEFERLTNAWKAQSPLPWDEADSVQVADSICFLLSEMSRAITGEIVHVDGGYHAMSAPLR